MSETITGKLEEIFAGKTGTGKRGKWTLWSVKVDGNKYGTGFEKVKAAVGDTVEFEVEENDRGYLEVVDGTFRVTKKATAAESAATKASNTSSSGSTNQSIENQVALKAAIEFVNSFELDTADALKLVATAYSQFANLLRAAPKAEAAKPAAAKPRPKPPVHEDDNQDEQEEETPDY